MKMISKKGVAIQHSQKITIEINHSHYNSSQILIVTSQKSAPIEHFYKIT